MSTPDKRMPGGSRASAEQEKEVGVIVPQGSPPLVLTRAECGDLAKNARLRASVAKADAKARGAQQMADFELALDRSYPPDHPAWRQLIAECKVQVEAVKAKLAAECDALAIPRPFRPRFECYWSDQGENKYKERRAELRKVAAAVVEANLRRTCLEIDRTTADIQTRLLAGTVMSDDARAFLTSMPSIEALLPPPTLEAIELIANA